MERTKTEFVSEDDCHERIVFMESEGWAVRLAILLPNGERAHPCQMMVVFEKVRP